MDNNDNGLLLQNGVHGQTHKLEKRLASMDENFYMLVTSRAFQGYFSGENLITCKMTKFVHPDEVERFETFINGCDDEGGKELFRLMGASGEYRYNIVRCYGKKSYADGSMCIDIEIIDVEDALILKENTDRELAMMRLVMGVTDEYMFSYNRNTNTIKIYHFDEFKRVVDYKMDLDEWRKEMLKKGYVPAEEKAAFLTFLTDLKVYTQSFTAKLTCSIRTQGRFMENLRFVGVIYGVNENQKEIVGRIFPEENSNKSAGILEIMDELQYDALTNVYNKKTITEYAKKRIQEKPDERVGIVVLDIDHFKNVNDTYGHLYGDKVLERAGEKLKEVVGEDGVVGRIGGDEFMLVLNDVNDDQMLRSVLRSIRTQIKWEFVEDFVDLTLTCSIGAATYPNNGNDFEELFKKADHCLYIAKQKGRDRYVFFRDDVHRQSYEESLAKKDNQTPVSRDNKILSYAKEFMQAALCDRDAAIKNLLHTMLESYNIDNINIYYGEDLKLVYSAGECSIPLEKAEFATTDEYRSLIESKDYFVVDYCGSVEYENSEFAATMRNNRVFSTIQCLIGKPGDVKGLVTFNRCKEAAKWADYEVNMAVIFASYLSVIS